MRETVCSKLKIAQTLLFFSFRVVGLLHWIWLVLWLDSPKECSASDFLGLLMPDHKKTWSFCLGLLKCLLPKLFPLEYLHLEFSDHVVRKPKQFLEWPYMVKNQSLQLIVWLSINSSTILPSMGGEVLEVDQIASVKLPWLLPQRTLISTA